MSSENTTIAPADSLERRLSSSSQSVFQGDGLRFLCYPVLPGQKILVDDSRLKTREFSGFMDEKMCPTDRERFCQPYAMENRRESYGDPSVQRNREERRNWKPSGTGIKFGGGGSEEEDDLEEDEDCQEDERLADGERDCNVTNRFKSSGDTFYPVRIDDRRLKQHVNHGESANLNFQQGKDNHFQNALPITVVSGDGYYTRALSVAEMSTTPRVDLGMAENGSGSTSRKEAPLYESVRAILSDPITGELMDDAVIFPCGHSFGAGGLHHSLQKKACYTCSLPITEESVRKNLTLRAAVAAFRREENTNSSSKRRRDLFEEKANISDLNHMRSSSRGLHFPFAVADRVMIVGNKRTPLRFVGREAIITAQCLNGWYVVKTLDTAESVKLQYRSLAKVSEDRSSKKAAPN